MVLALVALFLGSSIISVPAIAQVLPGSAPAESNLTPAVPPAVPAMPTPSLGNPAPAPVAAPAAPQTSAAPLLPGDAPALPGEAPVGAEAPGGPGLPVPNFFQADPSMSLTAQDMGPAVVTEEEAELEKRRAAFNAALQMLLPLKPEEIRELLEKFDRTQESVELPVYPAPVPEIAVETLSLDPGVKPSVIKVAYGNVTTFTVVDVTGAPWPIEDISWAGNFEIVESGNGDGSHILRITPQSEFATGNMSIRLLTLKTPVIISLETSRDKVHYRFDAVIPDYGPMATTPLIDQGISISAGDRNISSVLQGVIPEKAQKLAVTGVDGRTTAYRFGGQTFVRTPLTLLSPSWSNSVSSADGTHVYSVQNAPVLLLSDKGKMVRARLSERTTLVEDAIK